MDFGDLIWIVPLLYALKRMIFGPRKSEKAKKPAARKPRRPEPAQAPAPSGREELREALGAIGAALGLPEDMLQKSGGRKKSGETADVADYPPALPPPAKADPGLERNAGMDPGASLFPMGAAPEETAAYDLWRERAAPEAIYEADAAFAGEDAFETGGIDPIPEHADAAPETLAGKRSPYERTKRPGQALRRLVAQGSLQETVVLKELLDRPVSMRRRAGLPFRA